MLQINKLLGKRSIFSACSWHTCDETKWNNRISLDPLSTSWERRAAAAVLWTHKNVEGETLFATNSFAGERREADATQSRKNGTPAAASISAMQLFLRVELCQHARRELVAGTGNSCWCFNSTRRALDECKSSHVGAFYTSGQLWIWCFSVSGQQNLKGKQSKLCTLFGYSINLNH